VEQRAIMATKRFDGRVYIITGASRGIGRAAALHLAAEGGKVGINFRSHPDEAQEVLDQCRQLGGDGLLLQADVADQRSVEDMVQKTVETFGRLDGYVSNAAYSDRELMVKADMEGFRRTIDVSMWGAFYGCRAAARQMIEQEPNSGASRGSILIVSSPHAVIPIPSAMAYNMAKAAIDHMARTAAIELAQHKVRVNILHPGWIDTPGERKFFSEEQLAQGAAGLPWKRLGTPEEIAKAIGYMLSDDADYMTGSTFLIDGGVSLPWWSNRAEGKQ
jgi:glucose 1-dehydrogenase